MSVAVCTIGMALCTIVGAQDSSICSTVTCIANGETSCDRASAQCPVCMYTISGGYSCYDKIRGVCPYPDLLLICRKWWCICVCGSLASCSLF